MTPSQSARTRKRNPKRTPGDQYDVHAYRRAIARGVAKANRALKRAHKGKPGELQLIPKWGPNRLRHNAATKLRREFGIETARAALGHSTLNTTEIYAEQDEARILDVMQQVG
jgi:integrase